LGRSSVSSRMRVPRPPQSTKTGTSAKFLLTGTPVLRQMSAAGDRAKTAHRLRSGEAGQLERIGIEADQMIVSGDHGGFEAGFDHGALADLVVAAEGEGKMIRPRSQLALDVGDAAINLLLRL